MNGFFQIENLSRNFGGIQAVNAANLRMEENEILGIIGPNGAGKTTLFNLICGVYSPGSGRILFKGQEIQGKKPHWIAKRGIGRTFQICQPFKDLTVLENVLVSYGHSFYDRWTCFGRYEGRSHVEGAMKLLAQLGLEKYRNWESKDLPLALQRRLEIARALALNPEIILLDESAAGLTYEESLDLVKLVRELKHRGKSIILIEHNMNVAMEVSERLYVLDHGTVIAEGTPEVIQKDERVINAYLGSE
jgi:ABC-type branched-subunit amino acid transport system ATPase component